MHCTEGPTAKVFTCSGPSKVEPLLSGGSRGGMVENHVVRLDQNRTFWSKLYSGGKMELHPKKDLYCEAWGCFSEKGTGVHCAKERVNGATYCEILSINHFPSQ